MKIEVTPDYDSMKVWLTTKAGVWTVTEDEANELQLSIASAREALRHTREMLATPDVKKPRKSKQDAEPPAIGSLIDEVS